MDRYFRLTFFIASIFLLQACAELGVITGGPKDVIAPKPVENGIQPPNGSTNFSSRTIVFQFDEYFQLNNPVDNISILPTDLKITTAVDKKKLTLKLDGNFQPNTTYQISFNGAVRDLNEGNDSLMKYVFSTGDKIDSLIYSGKVADAYTAVLQNQVLVALYREGDSLAGQSPVYFTKTNAEGEFNFDYLKNGSYKVYAFTDLNKDLKYQITEKAGFKTNTLVLDSSLTDSIPLLIFQGKLPAKITSKTYFPPNQLLIGANSDLSKTVWKYKDTIIDPRAINYFTTDSMSLCLPEEPKTDFYLTSDGFDTVFFRFNPKEYQVRNSFLPANKNISEFQKIKLLLSATIETLDTTLILAKTLDSVAVNPKFELHPNYLDISFAQRLTNSVVLTFLPKAMQYKNGQYNDTIRETFAVKKESEFGSLIFKTQNLPESSFVEILNLDKVVKQVSAEALKLNPAITFIEGGEYSFRIVLDENHNGKWDGGDVLKSKQAEKVLYFPQKVKVRANWETEVELEIK